jgi:hypothetical protein
MKAAMASLSNPNPPMNSASALKEALMEVERDEAEAIETLCALLERAEKSRNFDCLPEVRRVLMEWQNQPPRGIVTSLLKIREEMECLTPDNT